MSTRASAGSVVSLLLLAAPTVVAAQERSVYLGLGYGQVEYSDSALALDVFPYESNEPQRYALPTDHTPRAKEVNATVRPSSVAT